MSVEDIEVCEHDWETVATRKERRESRALGPDIPSAFYNVTFCQDRCTLCGETRERQSTNRLPNHEWDRMQEKGLGGLWVTNWFLCSNCGARKSKYHDKVKEACDRTYVGMLDQHDKEVSTVGSTDQVQERLNEVREMLGRT